MSPNGTLTDSTGRLITTVAVCSTVRLKLVVKVQKPHTILVKKSQLSK